MSQWVYTPLLPLGGCTDPSDDSTEGNIMLVGLLLPRGPAAPRGDDGRDLVVSWLNRAGSKVIVRCRPGLPVPTTGLTFLPVIDPELRVRFNVGERDVPVPPNWGRGSELRVLTLGELGCMVWRGTQTWHWHTVMITF